MARQTIQLELAGVSYPFRVPKVARIMQTFTSVKDMSPDQQELHVTSAQLEWMKKGFSEAAWEDIERRFDDDDDDLDFTDLIPNGFNDALKQVSARPTTSSSASSQPQQRTTPSVDEPSPPVSMFTD